MSSGFIESKAVLEPHPIRAANAQLRTTIKIDVHANDFVDASFVHSARIELTNISSVLPELPRPDIRRHHL